VDAWLCACLARLAITRVFYLLTCRSDVPQHAMCLDVLASKLQPGANVLDVGCGSGYLTVCMSLMVRVMPCAPVQNPLS
jgi:2-polyprenyl-3-methyl-5-hydroxy-6-metoxy-1,4-benzoquinol methylase